MQDQKLHIPIEKLKNEIKESPVKINSQVSSDFHHGKYRKISIDPIYQTFLGGRAAKISASTKSLICYRSMIIRYCLA